MKFVALPALLALSFSANAAFIVDTNANAEALAQNLLGSGITLVGVSTYTGSSQAAGTFTGFTTGTYTNPVTGVTGKVDINSGIVLSTGRVSDIARTFDGGANSELYTAGDAALSDIAGYNTNDAAILEFSFIPDKDQLFFQFVFASTEYPEWVNSSYNDVFGFFVNGNNIAVLPDGTTPITINSINVGKPTGTAASNPQFFTNYSQAGVTPYNLGGSTILLTATANVRANEVNTFRVAIADASDYALDSAVFLGAGSFSTEEPPPVGEVPEPSTYALVGLGLAAVAYSKRK